MIGFHDDDLFLSVFPTVEPAPGPSALVDPIDCEGPPWERLDAEEPVPVERTRVAGGADA